MRQGTQKPLALALALVMVLGLTPIPAFAEGLEEIPAAVVETVPAETGVPESEAPTDTQRPAETSAPAESAPTAEAEPPEATVPQEVPPEEASPDGEASIELAAELGGQAEGTIGTYDELKAMDPAGSYTLRDDIDLTGEGWTSIETFSGTLDGQGHTITLDGAPLFVDLAKDGTVKNLLLAGEVSGEGDVGALAFTSSGTIRNCFTKATVISTEEGWKAIGSFIGMIEGGNIINCLSTGTLEYTKWKDVGGIAGSGFRSWKIDNCYWNNEASNAAPYGDPNITNSEKVEESSLTSAGLAWKLNGKLQDGDLTWGVTGDSLVPGGREEPVALDTAALAAVIKIAEAITQAGGSYSDESWKLFQSALGSAREMMTGGMSQAAIDQAKDSLEMAQEKLTPVDKTALEADIQKMEGVKNPTDSGLPYTTASWASFESALASAKTAVEGLSQDAIDQADRSLKAAYESLKLDYSSETVEERKSLDAALEQVPAEDVLYSAASYSGFTQARSAALTVRSDVTKTKEEITSATKALNDAYTGLIPRKLPALAPPQETEWQDIHTLEEFLALDGKVGGYYRLQEDLKLIYRQDMGGGYFDPHWDGIALNSVLDGNGHVVTLAGGEPSGQPFPDKIYSNGVFSTIGENAAVFNLSVIGTVNKVGKSPFADNCAGLVFNCYSWASTNGGCGLVDTLQNGGVVHNSYAAGDAGSYRQGIAGTAEANTKLTDCYWLDTMAASAASGNGTLTNCVSKSSTELQSQEFRDLLNSGLDGVGHSWNENEATGYPWFGESGSHVKKTFTLAPKLGGDSVTVEEKGTLPLTPFQTDNYGYAGTLSFSGDPDARFQVISGTAVSVTSYGMVEIQGEGTAVVGAFDPDSAVPPNWLYTKELARITIQVQPMAIEDVRFTILGVGLADGVYTVPGRTAMITSVEVRAEGETNYRNADRYFTITGSDNLSVNGFPAAAVPQEPGKGTLTAVVKAGIFTGATQPVTIHTDSTYVPVKSVSLPSLLERYELHIRQAATTEDPGAFSYANAGGLYPVLEPENASYGSALDRDRWSITSSDPEVADYITTMVYNLVPRKAGSTDVTVTVTDPGDATHPAQTVSATKTATFVYTNPIRSIHMEQEALQLKAGATVELPLVFKGARDDYSVSETGMTWQMTGDGSVAMKRTPIVIPANQAEGGTQYVANPQWEITGVKAGTVHVVGTPVDQTNSVGSVEFTVTVTSGEKPQVDHDKLVAGGISGAQDFLATSRDLKYTDEWLIFSLLRSGGSISERQSQTYLDAVERWLRENISAPKTKPTDVERVAVTLAAMDQDLSDFRGIDLIAGLLSSEKIGDGSNEAIFALLVLDTKNYPVPDEVKWTRTALIDEIIGKYQNANGGFGLVDDKTAGTDMTAMAIQALAPYQGQGKVSQAVDKALDHLRDRQEIDGGFNNLESTAQVLTALSALKIDVLDEANGFVQAGGDLITFLARFQDQETGGFSHAPEGIAELMSSTQALYSLEAYRRCQTGGAPLYDCTDTDPRANLEKRVASAQRLVESDYTPETWKSFAQALAAAKAVLDDQSAGAEALKAASTALANAVAGLKKEQAPVDPGRPDDKKISVSFRLIGATQSDEDVDVGAGKGNSEYKTWIKTTDFTMGSKDTMYDLFTQALDDAGLDCEGAEDNYVKTITAPAGYGGYDLSEFDNGPRSGWMYLVNGKHPDIGLKYYRLHDGDEVIWHYVNDYSYEVEDWGGDRDDPSQGDDSTWVDWSKIPDTDPPSGSAGGTSAGGSQKEEATTEISPQVTVDKKTGAATAEVSSKEMDAAVKQAKADQATVIVIAPDVKKDVPKVSVTIPGDSAAAVAKEPGLRLAVKTPRGTVTLTGQTLTELKLDAKTPLSVSIETVATGTSQTKIEIKVGDKAITDLKGGLSVSLPVERAISSTVLVRMTENGPKVLKWSAVSGETLHARLSGSATVMVKDNAKTFADVPSDHWSNGAVTFAAAHELFQGVGGDRFAPAQTMTAPMLKAVLARLDDKDDAWDAALPDAPITRHDLAEAMQKLAGGEGDAMTWASEAKLLQGKENGALDPEGIATRAEVATVLQRYITGITSNSI